jgi:chromate transporter
MIQPFFRTVACDIFWAPHSNNTFLAGYGAAQALPGVLFSFDAYLGAVVQPQPHGAIGAAIALAAIFLPGLLLVIAVLPFWNQLRANDKNRAILTGVNASVVGILLSALYQPVWTSTILKPADFVVASAAFLALTVWKSPPWMVVTASAMLGVVWSHWF